IKADVEAIARMMCMQDVKPPLSIALFGQWGSGKSFFMTQLRKRVEKIKESVVLRGEEKAFYKDIIQIEFNAWHYVEANLWASLVSHMFETLKGASATAPGWEAQMQELLQRLSTVRQSKQKAEQELEAARAKAAEAQRSLMIKQNDAQLTQLALQKISRADVLRKTRLEPFVKEELNKAVKTLGLAPATESVENIAQTLIDAKRAATGMSAFLVTFWRSPGFALRLWFVSAAVLAPVLIPALMTLVRALLKTPAFDGQVKEVVAALGTVSALLVPLISTRKKAEDVLESLRKASAEFDKTVAEKRAELTKESEVAVVQAQAELQKAREAAEQAGKSVEAATKALEDASPMRALNIFIEERSASGDYRKSLGTLALVRQDFEKLSMLMRNARDFRAGKLRPGDDVTKEDIERLEKLPSIDRIILYIDDLDRCPPRQVIQVLQAIQLLLAFDLFVVVVGVDPRWISRSLLNYYPELLAEDNALLVDQAGKGEVVGDLLTRPQGTTNAAARPLDYLEKIFQIPFWIKPLGGQDAGLLIRGLVSTEESQDASRRTGANEKRQVGNVKTEASDGRAGGASGSVGGEEPGPAAGGSTVEKQVLLEVVASGKASGFASMKLSGAEVNFLSKFESLAGATPRAIKRFVNIYRLLRARVSKAGEKEFLGEYGKPREFEAVMYLLAMFNSTPSLAERFCAEMERLRDAQRDRPLSTGRPLAGEPLLDVIRQLETQTGLSEPEQAMLRSIRAYAEGFEQPRSSVDSYYRWHNVIARYSFVGQLPIKPKGEAPAENAAAPNLM